ncbi:MAG: SEC-C domain-containing protein, partial [Cellulomonadaceae bacterium]|nr:SEC-C domain-containing protein [Cellulomonadaceae bacterium]
ALKSVYPVSISADDVLNEAGGMDRVTADDVKAAVMADADEAYTKREELLTPDGMRQLERRVVLSVLDRKWREHLYEMDYLKEGIGLRAMAQRDPLVEYQHEGYDLFTAMMDAIKEESVGFLYNLEVQVKQAEAEVSAAPAAEQQPEAAAIETTQPVEAPAVETAPADHPEKKAAPVLTGAGLDEPRRQVPLSFSGPSESEGAGLSDADPAASAQKARRTLHNEAQASHKDGQTFPGAKPNAPCPCGSGKKYKMCHGKNEA